MKPSLRNLMGSIALLGQVAGCGPDHDRQMIYTMPRGATVRRDPPTSRRPKAVARVPAARPLPPSNGVDVPIIGPE